MSDSNLTFAKIVANPNAYSWSQAYNAGKLFAVLSLEAEEESQEKDYLNVLGKEILDTLEQEFFTLETKDLESIKQAVVVTSEKIPQEINCSFVIGSVVGNVLYVYILGNGRVSLKREAKLGNLLEARDQKPDALKTASGFLQDGDIVILQTKQFSDIISIGTLTEFIDSPTPSEAAENLAPIIHEKEEAAAAAIIISYKPLTANEVTEQAEEEATIEEISEAEAGIEEQPETEIETKAEAEAEVEIEEPPFYTPSVNKKTGLLPNLKQTFSSLISKPRITRSANLNLNHSRKVILTIVVIILVVFVGSIIFAMNKQQNEKIQSAFQSIYPQAQKKYSDGQNLAGLNQNLARDSFTQAQQILDSGKDKLPKNSKEEKQVLDLLAKVNEALNQTSGVTATAAKPVDASVSPFLLAETKNDGLYFTEDSSHIYGIAKDQVFSLNADGSGKKTLIKNNSDWQQAGGLSTYNGNVYVLDKKQNQILKFVQTDSGFSSANYFSGTQPDLSKGVSMAIDSDVYILSSDGMVAKYTKGTADNFALAGFDMPLSNPTSITTNATDDNIYILDNGNSRIVVVDKNGNYKSQYQASILKTAKDFEVLEKDKKVYVLSGGKIYEIDLK
jgi:hypothetical protein